MKWTWVEDGMSYMQLRGDYEMVVSVEQLGRGWGGGRPVKNLRHSNYYPVPRAAKISKRTAFGHCKSAKTPIAHSSTKQTGTVAH